MLDSKCQECLGIENLLLAFFFGFVVLDPFVDLAPFVAVLVTFGAPFVAFLGPFGAVLDRFVVAVLDPFRFEFALTCCS